MHILTRALVAGFVVLAASPALAQSPTFTGLTVTIPSGYGSLVVAPATQGSEPSAAAQSINAWTPSFSGGSGVVKSVNVNEVTIYGAPTDYIWANLNTLYYSGSGGGSGQHVANYNQTIRFAYNAGGTANNPGLWAETNDCEDQTHQTTTNAFVCVEIDQKGSGEDLSGRQLLVGVIAPSTEVGALGYFESNGINVQATTGGYASHFYGGNGSYITAMMDYRYAYGYGPGVTSLSAGSSPTVTASVTSSTTVHVSNLMPFVHDIYGRNLNAFHANTPIYFYNGTTLVATGSATAYAHDTGPLVSGTITLSAPVTVNSGNTVANFSRAIWLPTGSTIALDTTGVVNLSSDGTSATLTGPFKVAAGSGTALDVHLTTGTGMLLAGTQPIVFNTAGNSTSAELFENGSNYLEVFQGTGLQVDGLLYGIGNATFGGTVSVSGKLTAASPVILPAYTVATLPACSGQQNAMAVVTDATAPTYNGALTGSGTVRVPVFCNGTSWSSH